MYHYFLIIVKIILVLLFLWRCEQSIQKFTSGRKSIETRLFDEKYIQYPSITVCVQNTFKISLDDKLKNALVKEAEILAKENVWKRNETFYFVNHPTVKTNGYPCMTTRDSTDSGKPCSFPFIYTLGKL